MSFFLKLIVLQLLYMGNTHVKNKTSVILQ